MHHRGEGGLNRTVPVNKYPIKRRSKVASHALKYYFSDGRRKTQAGSDTSEARV